MAPGVSLIERTRIWEENRQKKIKEKQDLKGVSEVEECTFKPIVVRRELKVEPTQNGTH